MLTCKEITELITERLEGKLSLADTLRFEMHVGLCRPCRAYLRQMKITVQALGHLPPDPVPDDVMEELLTRFRSWRKTA